MPTLGLFKEFSTHVDQNTQILTSVPNFPTYDAHLVDALESEHEDLLELFNKVLQIAKSDEYSMLQLAIVEFATSFTTHIKIEDEQLYGYLKVLASKKSKVEQRVVAQFANEMQGISTSIFDILSQSTHVPFDVDSIDDFILEFERIGALLTDRIQREEHVLYPIYKNSQKSVKHTQPIQKHINPS